MKEVFKNFKADISYLFLMFASFLLLSALALLGIAMNEKKWLQIIFMLLLIVTYVMLAITLGRSTASRNYKTMRANQARLSRGEKLSPSQKLSGYNHFKGYIIGLIPCLPLLIMLIVSACIGDASKALDGAIKSMYCLYYLPIYTISESASIQIMYYAIAFNSIIMGVFYNLFGLRLARQQQSLVDEKASIANSYAKMQQHIYKSENAKEDEKPCE